MHSRYRTPNSLTPKITNARTPESILENDVINPDRDRAPTLSLVALTSQLLDFDAKTRADSLRKQEGIGVLREACLRVIEAEIPDIDPDIATHACLATLKAWHSTEAEFRADLVLQARRLLETPPAPSTQAPSTVVPGPIAPCAPRPWTPQKQRYDHHLIKAYLASPHLRSLPLRETATRYWIERRPVRAISPEQPENTIEVRISRIRRGAKAWARTHAPHLLVQPPDPAPRPRPVPRDIYRSIYDRLTRQL